MCTASGTDTHSLELHEQQAACLHERSAESACRCAAVSLTGVAALSGCHPTPLSTLHPDSAQAAHIAHVWNLMAWGSLVILLIMVALVFLAVRAQKTHWRHRSLWLLLGGGAVFPVSVMAALLAYVYLGAPAQGEAKYHVRVTAQQWHWAVAYPDAPQGERYSVNVIHIPQGVPTLIELEATDVIHSFWVPRLGGKMDAIPGRVNHLILTASETGSFAGQCAEYCGIGHAAMHLQVVVHPPDQLNQIIASLPAEQDAP